jgi:hypothetical protein
MTIVLLVAVLALQIWTLIRQEKLMSTTNQGLTDLNAAETSLATSVTAAVALIQQEVAALQAANAASGDPDAAVEAAAQNINTQIAALNAAVAAATTPAPAQQPTAQVKKS